MSFIGRKLWGERSWKARSALVAGFTLATAGGVGYIANSLVHSDGERDGIVTKFSEKGGPFVCYTHEGELAMANFSVGGAVSGPKGAGVGNNSFAFSVQDERIAQAIKDVRQISKETGNPVQVSLAYNQHFFPLKIWPIPPLCQRATEYDIVGISYRTPDGKYVEVKKDDAPAP
ncbi:MAG: hypothetical protein WC043_01760 [Pseudobdellovibrionaceae bacterium]